MKGTVDGAGRALIGIEIDAPPHTPTTIQAWIDTGFTGELALPQKIIDDMGLTHSGSVAAVLADGTQIALKTYTCIVMWFGQARQLEVVATPAITHCWASGFFWTVNFELTIDSSQSPFRN
ncbi:MAG: hypothetical protein ACJ8C4_14600 [Gemmataceae bacterium]